MNKDFPLSPAPDHLAAFFQAVQVSVKIIADVGLSDAPDRATLTALAFAGDNMECCLKAAQDARFRPLARPVSTTDFNAFVDNFGDMNG